MVKTGNSKWRQPFCFVVFASFTMSFMLLFYLYHSSSLVNDQRLAMFANKPAHLFALNNQPIDEDDDEPPPPPHKTTDDYDSDNTEPQPNHKTMAAIDQDSDEDNGKTGADDDQDVDKSRIDDEEPKVDEEDGDQSSASVTEEMDEASFDSGTRTVISEPIREKKKIAESPVRKRRVKGNAEKEKNGYGYGYGYAYADGTMTSKPKKGSVGGRGNRNQVESFNAQKKGSVQKRRNRGNAEEARKFDDAKTVPHKLAVDHHKPIPKKKRNRGNAEEVRGTKRVANKKKGSRGNIDQLLEIDDAKIVSNKKNKKGASQHPGNRGNTEKARKTGGAKRVVNKLPVDVPHNKMSALKHKKAPKVSEKRTQHVVKKEDEDEEEEQEREEQEQEKDEDEEEENVKEKEEDGDSDEEEAESVGRSSEGATTEQPQDNNLITSENDSICRGRYIYIHELPSRFNEDMIKNCKSLDKWLDMCQYLANHGLGPLLNKKLREFTRGAWFDTNQFTLELIFHNRMKQYECLTKDSSKASAIYLPYYSGLDVSRYLWHDKSLKDSAALDLVAWLRDQPEWKRMWGRDHFFVAGRITWDFRREGDNSNNWGNNLMFLPESKNMSILTIESSPWHRNDFAIPYPSYFHPKHDYQVRQWQRLVRKMKRDYLFSFAGGPRPNLPNSVRGEIISQCRAARHKCNLLECVEGDKKCYQPANVMRMFQNSVFCLQPSGDSFTRRSMFDSILAGCIPVFFHPGSAYVQYLWHLPGDFTKYSVYIPGKDVKEGRAGIERVLSQIPRAKVVGMREHLIQLIPKITYANPGFKLETKDAFDVAIEGVLGRVEGVREEMMEGRDDSIGFDEEQSWKYYTYGRLGEHEWDDLFDRSKNNSGIERNK